ncbi:MAG: transglycosylase SLT domain-containing protein, partial [Myxococcota bacterium]|nr:transglycosylase SLT domain-containing protein [Myxococcota bacterium]
GSLLLRGKDPHGALSALSQSVVKQHPLIDFAYLRQAEAYLDLAQADAVEKSLNAIRSPEIIGDFYHRLLAWALREQGRLSEAKVIYQSLINSKSSEEIPIAHLGLARVAASEGNAKVALNHLKALDVNYPRHWATRRGQAIAAQFGVTHPTLIGLWTHRTPAELLGRSQVLLTQHRNRAAVQALKKMANRLSTGPLACEHQYSLGRGLRKLRRWKQAYPILKKAVRICRAAHNEREAWAIHLLGKAAERLGREDEAVEIFKSQVKRHRAHRLADDAAYFIIRDAIEDRDDLNLAESLVTRYTQWFPEGDMMHDAVFFVVSHAFSRQEFDRAKRVIELRKRLSAPPPTDSHLGRGLYWEARILDRLGQRQRALAVYREALGRCPLSWYGFLSYSRLKDIVPRKAEAWFADALRGNNETTPAFLRAESTREDDDARWSIAAKLAEIGLADDAWALIKRSLVKEDGSIWRAAKLLDAAGAHAMSHDIVRRRLSSFRYAPSRGASRALWEVAYPRPLKALVDRAAASSNVPSHFVRAVIREESGFRPAIESFANAIGLMQLLVPTGRQIAHRSEGRITRSRLQTPDLNVKLGARYLAHVRKVTGAQDALIPPGYNAGPGAVKRWLKERGHLPLDLFVELIPYKEARDYTKKVMASYGIYKALYQGGQALYIGQNTRATKRPMRRSSKKRRTRLKRKR